MDYLHYAENEVPHLYFYCNWMRSFNQDELKQILNIPDKYEIALLLTLGYPDESPVPEIAADSIKY